MKAAREWVWCESNDTWYSKRYIETVAIIAEASKDDYKKKTGRFLVWATSRHCNSIPLGIFDSEDAATLYINATFLKDE